MARRWHRRAGVAQQLVEHAEGHVELRLVAARPRDPCVAEVVQEALDQRRLADPRRPFEEHDPARPRRTSSNSCWRTSNSSRRPTKLRCRTTFRIEPSRRTRDAVKYDRIRTPGLGKEEASRPAWRTTILAALASYIDAGSIVAGAAGLALWAQEFGLSSSTIGLIGAFSSNAISAGVGALIGGWLCDRYGRKRIYQWDLLLYAFGAAWIVFATEPWTLICGYAIVGLAVGADVPASWTLIAETAPRAAAGDMAGPLSCSGASARWSCWCSR